MKKYFALILFSAALLFFQKSNKRAIITDAGIQTESGTANPDLKSKIAYPSQLLSYDESSYSNAIAIDCDEQDIKGKIKVNNTLYCQLAYQAKINQIRYQSPSLAGFSKPIHKTIVLNSVFRL